MKNLLLLILASAFAAQLLRSLVPPSYREERAAVEGLSGEAGPASASRETSAMPAAPPLPSVNPSELVTLDSVDGRQIKARVLYVANDKATIVREDGKTFDLPLSRLKADSKALVLRMAGSTTQQGTGESSVGPAPVPPGQMPVPPGGANPPSYPPQTMPPSGQGSPPQATSGKPSQRYISGVSPADVYTLLENRGFTMEHTYDQKNVLWTCTFKKGPMTQNCVMEGDTTAPNKMHSLRATVFSMSDIQDPDELGRSFLGLFTALPFTGGDPDQARIWLATQVGRNGSCTIGGLKLEVASGWPNRRTLRITAR